MTDSVPSAHTRKAVPLWVQVLIWAGLVGLLVLMAIGLSRRQQGTVQPGDRVREFELELFSGYE